MPVWGKSPLTSLATKVNGRQRKRPQQSTHLDITGHLLPEWILPSPAPKITRSWHLYLDDIPSWTLSALGSVLLHVGRARKGKSVKYVMLIFGKPNPTYCLKPRLLFLSVHAIQSLVCHYFLQSRLFLYIHPLPLFGKNKPQTKVIMSLQSSLYFLYAYVLPVKAPHSGIILDTEALRYLQN